MADGPPTAAAAHQPPMFKRMFEEVQDAKRKMMRMRSLHGTDPDAALDAAMGAEEVFEALGGHFLRTVWERVPHRFLPPHLYWKHQIISPETPLLGGCLKACCPLVDSFDKQAARVVWRKLACAVFVLVAFKQSVKRQYEPGGSGFERAWGEFESLARERGRS